MLLSGHTCQRSTRLDLRLSKSNRHDNFFYFSYQGIASTFVLKSSNNAKILRSSFREQQKVGFR